MENSYKHYKTSDLIKSLIENSTNEIGGTTHDSEALCAEIDRRIPVPRCRMVWRAGVLRAQDGSHIPDGSRCLKLQEHDGDHEFMNEANERVASP